MGRLVLFSLSESIKRNKNNYFNALKAAQRSNEITEWINYFVKTVLDAQIDAEQKIEFILKRASSSMAIKMCLMSVNKKGSKNVGRRLSIF